VVGRARMEAIFFASETLYLESAIPYSVSGRAEAGPGVTSALQGNQF
jgi:hypothetical protein